MSVNVSMVMLYWDIGRTILDRQEREGWGKRIIDRLSLDLRSSFPEMKGLSPRNLKYMRAFASAWPDRKIVQEVLAQIPWYHNIALLEKVQDREVRLYYAEYARQEGWSRNILVMQIESDLISRHGKAVTNFTRTLMEENSDMAVKIFKGPYIFEFLKYSGSIREHDLEEALIKNIQKFLLELGVGFSFIGNQFRLQVGKKDFYVDLLLFHRHLRCLVAIELKVGEFQPEFVGKMQFYLTALDRKVRRRDENPSIGIILCKDKDRTIVEYALHTAGSPVGVATYQMVRNLPRELKNVLPDPETMAKVLEEDE